MYSNKCLFWEHGTLLQPQHLQIATMQNEAQSALFSNAHCPHNYGIRRVGFREEALLMQSLELHVLDMVLPTGEHLVLGDNTLLPARRFDEVWTDPEEPLEVWLGLAPLNPSGDNVSECNMLPTSLSGISTRFVAPFAPEPVPDLYGTGPRADMRFMLYNAQLVFGSEKKQQETLTMMPLARLERDGDTIRFVPSYAPPCMDIHASPLLLEHLRGIRNSVVARSGHLEEYKLLPTVETGRQESRPPLTVQNFTLYAMHGILARYAPLLEHLCEAPVMHPWLVYGLLRQLVGELSTFSPDITPLGETARGERLLPAYDHHNLGPCFAAARSLVTRVIDSLVMGPAYSFTLDVMGDHFGCHLPAHACGNAYRHWLLVRPSRLPLPSGEHMARRARLAPGALLQSLVSKSLPGVGLIFVEQPPVGLSRRADTLYFAIDQSDRLWENIMTTGDLSLFLPDVDSDAIVQLALLQR